MDEVPGHILKLVGAINLYNIICENSAKFIQDELKYDASPQVIGDDEWDILTWSEVGFPDPMLGVWAGELVHDVRSALDHLVYRLIRENNGDPGKHSQFPIYSSEKEWIRDIEERDPSLKPSPIDGVTDDEFAFIKESQPYHLSHKKRARDPLMQLLHMSNVDKHQTLHVAALRAHTPTRVLYQPPGYIKIVRKRFVQLGTLVEPGTEIGRVQRRIIKRPPPDTQVQIRIRGVAEIVFMEQDKPPIAGVNDLGEMIRTARRIVHGLRPWASAPLPEGW